MFKYILRLLAASASLVALLVVTNPAIATPTTQADSSVEEPEAALVSLNVLSPSLQSNSDTDSLLQHLGCSCAACTQSSVPSERQI